MPGGEPVIGVGTAASGMREVRRSLLEARQVADAAAETPGPRDGRPFYRLSDLRLRGLLSLLGGDARLATFVERELGPLREYDAAHGTGLISVLGAYLAAGGNKAAPPPGPTWPGPPCTSGCGTSSASSGSASTRPSHARRCTSPCSPRSGRRRSPGAVRSPG